MTVDVDVAVYNGGEIGKPVYLAAFFSAASAAVCSVHGVELPSILVSLGGHFFIFTRR